MANDERFKRELETAAQGGSYAPDQAILNVLKLMAEELHALRREVAQLRQA